MIEPHTPGMDVHDHPCSQGPHQLCSSTRKSFDKPLSEDTNTTVQKLEVPADHQFMPTASSSGGKAANFLDSFYHGFETLRLFPDTKNGNHTDEGRLPKISKPKGSERARKAFWHTSFRW
mmetsp:Transcript_17472/g.24497  ORF Transcript_17472/g.24497 Transcript_17472/m.24497 type:complete len:120 (-) Transcript_17472:325-684(-)